MLKRKHFLSSLALTFVSQILILHFSSPALAQSSPAPVTLLPADLVAYASPGNTGLEEGRLFLYQNGSYLDFQISGAALVTVNINSVPFTKMRYQIDNNAPVDFTLNGGASPKGLDNAVNIPLPNTSAHSVKIYVLAFSGGNYLGPNPFPKVLSLVGPAGTVISQRSDKKPLKAYFFGDSTTADATIEGAVTVDGLHKWAPKIAAYLNAEPTLIGNGSTGWLRSNQIVFTPGLRYSWNRLRDTVSRLDTNGKFLGNPDFVFITEGINDNPNTNSVNTAGVLVTGTPDMASYAELSAAIQTRLTAFREAMRPEAILYVVTPVTGANFQNIVDGFNAYQAVSPDANTRLLLSTANGTTNLVPAPTYSVDGTHPNAAGNTLWVNRLIAEIQRTKR